MATKLTPKEKKLADIYLDTGNGTQSALVAYETTDKNTAAVIASRTLSKAKVRDYLDSKAEKAAEIVFTIAQHGESDQVRLSASKDILDRAGYGEVIKTANVNLNLTREAGDIDLDTLVNKVESELKQQKLNG